MIIIYSLLPILVHAAMSLLMAAQIANPWWRETPSAKQAERKEFQKLFFGFLPFILLVCWGIYASLSRY